MRTYSAGIVTAYGSAKTGGYTGTYAEFCEALGNLADVLEDLEGLTVVANTLPEGSSATASYSDGVLTLGIPKGDKGDTGEKGDTGNGISSVAKTGTSGLVDTYTITFTDGTTETFTVTNGAKGDTGEKGDTGNGIASITKTATVGKVDTYTITYTDGTTTTFDVTNGEVTEADLESALTTAQPDLIAGSSDALLSDNYTLDREPYIYREGKCARAYEEVVGGSVGWNQRARPFEETYWQGEPNVTVTCADGVATISSGTAGNGARSQSGYGVNVIKDHKYFCTIDAKCSATLTSLIFGTTSGSGVYFTKANFTSASYVTISGIKNCVATTNNHFFVYGTGVTYTDLMVKNFMLIDLTQMFGSAIADYLYSLEQNTAGAGVALFRKMFPNSYYPYNAGELLSVKTSAHRMVGFNQWDEEWEVGYISLTSGQNANSSNQIRSKNYIPVLPNTVYAFVLGQPSSVWAHFPAYDANKNYIGDIGGHNSGSTFTTPTNCRYIRFYCAPAYGSTYNNDICINISGSRNGEYEPYESWSYPLDSSLELRGVPKLDSANNLYFDGDTYQSDGTVTRKYGIVDLGTLDWARYQFGSVYAFYINLPTKKSGLTSAICGKYLVRQVATSAASLSDKEMDVSSNTTYLYIRDDSYTDAASFKTAMSGVYLVYELAAPTTESADAYQHLQRVGSTEEWVDDRTVAVPVGHNTKCLEDLKAKIEGLPWDLSMIAPIESGTTSSRAYAVGEYFLLNNQFCKALTNIASGATFTLNTNYTITTIGAELKALQ